YVHNYLGIEEYKVSTTDKLPAGTLKLRMEFSKTGAPDFKIGKGSPGTVRLFVDEKMAGEGKIPVTVPLGYGLSGDGLVCGKDTVSAVSAAYAGSEFPFTGRIRRVTVDVAPDQHETPARKERD